MASSDELTNACSGALVMVSVIVARVNDQCDSLWAR